MASAVSRWPTDSTRELASSASIAVLAASAAAASAMERRTSILAGHLVIRAVWHLATRVVIHRKRIFLLFSFFLSFRDCDCSRKRI